MDIIITVLYISVIFMCIYTLYILNKMKDNVDSITLELNRMSERIKKWK